MALWKVVTTVAMVAVLTLGPASAGADLARAQGPAAETSPTPLGEVIVEDSLAGPGLVSAFECSTGRDERKFLDGAFQVRVTGRCNQANALALLSTELNGVNVPDGEIRMEIRTLAGADRVSFRMLFRTQTVEGAFVGYRVQIDPGPDSVSILKQTTDGVTPIARRAGIGRRLGSGEWMSVSLRLDGPRMWLFLDDALVLSTVDDTYATGDTGFTVFRNGNADDEAEVAVAIRNVRVKGLASGDPERLPRLTSRQAAFPSPPAVEEIILEEPLLQPVAMPATACPTGLGAIEHTGEGVLFKTRGRCLPESTTALVSGLVRGLSVLDGEVAVSFKIISGSPRTEVGLSVRQRDRASLQVFLNPANGAIGLTRFDTSSQRLASRDDVHRVAHQDGWNRLAIRMRGSEVWVLLNDQAVLYSQDGNLGVGGAGIIVYRSGDINSERESGIVFADLKVSALEDGDPARWPSFRQP